MVWARRNQPRHVTTNRHHSTQDPHPEDRIWGHERQLRGPESRSNSTLGHRLWGKFPPFHDPSQLPFMELMGSMESVHVGQFWPYDHLKTRGQALHLYQGPETHQELFFWRITILLSLKPSPGENGFRIIRGHTYYPIRLAINPRSYLFSPWIPTIS